MGYSIFELNIFLSKSYFAVPVKSSFLIFSGLFLRYALIKTGQLWANSYSQTATFMLLPVVTYVITTVIAGNIALSLGMVGALSIVRFRNPVKSPLELVMFFLLITLGISAAPKFQWAVVLLLTSVAVLFFIYLLNIFFKKYLNKDFYGVSFSEGNELSTLEIESEDIDLPIYNDKNLISYSVDGKIATYRLASINDKELKSQIQLLKNNNKTKKIELHLAK